MLIRRRIARRGFPDLVRDPGPVKSSSITTHGVVDQDREGFRLREDLEAKLNLNVVGLTLILLWIVALRVGNPSPRYRGKVMCTIVVV